MKAAIPGGTLRAGLKRRIDVRIHEEETFDFNGLNAETGCPMTRLNLAELKNLALGERIEPSYFEKSREWSETVKDLPLRDPTRH